MLEEGLAGALWLTAPRSSREKLYSSLIENWDSAEMKILIHSWGRQSKPAWICGIQEGDGGGVERGLWGERFHRWMLAWAWVDPEECEREPWITVRWELKQHSEWYEMGKIRHVIGSGNCSLGASVLHVSYNHRSRACASEQPENMIWVTEAPQWSSGVFRYATTVIHYWLITTRNWFHYVFFNWI